MSGCDDVLERLDAILEGGPTEPEVAAHLDGCARCDELLARARATREGAGVLHEVRASAELVGRLKGMLRLPQACERATELISAALDGEVAAPERTELLEHIRGCAGCRATWEALATLREVGTQVRASGRLRARLALHPSQHVAMHHRRRRLDLRLATAAAYLLAALTVVLVGNPAQVARASSSHMEKAAVYTRAAVENRLASYTRGALGKVAAAEGWVEGKARAAWESARRIVGAAPENPGTGGDVVRDDKGGRS